MEPMFTVRNSRQCSTLSIAPLGADFARADDVVMPIHVVIAAPPAAKKKLLSLPVKLACLVTNYLYEV